MLARILITLLILAVPLASLRLLQILPPNRPRPAPRKRGGAAHLLIVLGSGGHTAEMMAMLQRAVSEKSHALSFDWEDFSQRTWVVGAEDFLSTERAEGFEHAMKEPTAAQSDKYVADKPVEQTCMIHGVPRARNIHQPLYTTPISALKCLWACIVLLLPQKAVDFPDIILCNGPATAAILVLASTILRYIDCKGCHSRGKMRTIYVESFARVKKPSLSGRLLVRAVDRFLVQWEQMDGFCGRAEYVGFLV